MGPRQRRCRNRKGYKPEFYQHELSKLDWHGGIDRNLRVGEQIKQLEERVELMTKNISTAVNNIAPMRTINERNKLESWKEDDSLREQKERESIAWRNWKHNPTDERKSEWEREKNATKLKIAERKSFHIRKEINEADPTDTGSLWRAVKRCINWNTSGAPRQLRKEDGSVESKNEDMAEILHKTMQKKVLDIVKDVEKYEESEETETRHVKDLLGDKSIEEFSFQEVTEEDLRQILKTLPRKTSTGIDDISYIELIDGEYFVIPILTEIINGII